MRKILLASVAALPLLSIGVLPASAQQLKEKGGGASQSGGLSQSPGAGGAKEKSSAQGTVGQGRSSGSEDRAAKSSAAPDRTEGRAPSGGREDRLGQSEKGRTGADQANDMKSKAQEQGKADQAQGNVKNEGKSADQIKGKSQDQAKSKSTASSTDQAKSKGKNPGQTTGSAGNQGQNQNQASGSAKNQARDNQNQNKAQQAKGQKQTPTTSGQSTRTNQQNEQNNTNARNEQGGRNEQGSVPHQGKQGSQGSQGSVQGSVTLNDQQRTRINETILSRRDVPRVDRVNFDIDVGRPVPREVRIRDVPRQLVEIHPEWRGHEFFVVRDEIIIVDRGRRIVARVPVGSSTTGERHTTTTTTTVEDLSPADIREIQQVLVEKGFYHGSVDGRLTPQFHDALITFQRREGIEATGRIDERTSASLGVSMHTEGRAGDREGGNANRAGGAQGGRDVNDQKSGQNNPAAGNERPSTSGQGNAQQAPGSRDDRNKNSESKPSGQTQQRPSTSGQAGPGNAQQSKPTQERPSTSGQGPSTSGQSQRNENQPAGPGGKGGAADTQRKRPQ